MYHEFYGLSRMPFQGSPDPDFLYASPTHREALASLEYGVQAGMGFILLTGEVGLGKTTLLRTFLRQIRGDQLFVIYLFHPLLRFDELLAAMAEDLGLDARAAGPHQMMREIQHELIERYQAGQRVVLIIDEAQRLPIETLENLRLISNLETDDAKLLQIVLVGQPELEAILARAELRQLNQRIGLRARLLPLSRKDSEAYVRHRLQQAGAVLPDQVIGTDAVRLLGKLAGGVPRRINALADLALVHGFGAGERPVPASRVRKVARARRDELAAAPVERRRRPVLAAALVLVLGLLLPTGEFLSDAEQIARPAVDPAVPPAAPPSLPAAAARTDAAPVPGGDGELAYIVNQQDTVARLVQQIYGAQAAARLPDILQRNPGLAADSRLSKGEILILPPFAAAAADSLVGGSN